MYQRKIYLHQEVFIIEEILLNQFSAPPPMGFGYWAVQIGISLPTCVLLRVGPESFSWDPRGVAGMTL